MAKRSLLFLILISVLVYSGCSGGGGGGGITPVIPTTGSVSGQVSGFQTTSFSNSNYQLSKKINPSTKLVVKQFNVNSDPIPLPNEKIIKFRPGISKSEIENMIQNIGGKIKKEIYGSPNTYVVIIDSKYSTFSIDSLNTNSQIEYIENNMRLRAFAVTPNDSDYPKQKWNYEMIHLPEAWEIQKGNTNVIVAVIDSGVSLSHEDLAENLVAGYDFVDDDDDPSDSGYHEKAPMSHGTHVAGIISAVTNNNKGVAGVAWNVKIMPVRVLGPDGSGDVGAIASGINWAVTHGAHIINLSLGEKIPAAYGPQVIKDAIDAAVNQGVTVVAAAGNESTSVAFPANYQPVIAVAALNDGGLRANYSNYGPEICVAAPGGGATTDPEDGVTRNIYSTYYEKTSSGGTNKYGYLSGTSMACPHVSGVVALLYSKGITSPAAIRERLQATAYDLGDSGKDDLYGYGRIDAYAALNGVNPDVRSVKVFACDSDGQIIGMQRNPDSLGFYTLSKIPAGSWKICAFYDKNMNGVVDSGDQFASTETLVPVYAGQTTQGVDLTLTKITELSASLSLEEYVKSIIK
ncbi:MAG: peptidase S8 [Firmicutes bacterium]|nr:peptidase S8 [Bacillota bacterium]